MYRMRIRWITWIERGRSNRSVSQVLKGSRNITAAMQDANQRDMVVSL